ncbi:hypothetical protein DV737_g1865, partial [Chaetothyriales sp. CBS 132003]
MNEDGKVETAVAELLYEEEGQLEVSLTAKLAFSRKYIWRLNQEADAGTISVWFTKPGTEAIDYLFHKINVDPGKTIKPERGTVLAVEGSGGHLCVEDFYNSIYTFYLSGKGEDEHKLSETLFSSFQTVHESPKRSRDAESSGKRARPKKGAHIWISEGPQEGTEDEGSVVSLSRIKKTEDTPEPKSKAPGTSVGTRRQPNGNIGSVYSGSKVRHIKNEDGTPLLRGVIQYEFLRLVIENDQKVFTKFHGKRENGCTFADIYIDCLITSSKTSKILKDRLVIDRQAANNMAMICLLVNVGRMNTTLNFFPEMRAQLRTYHSIPVLQAYESQKDYKSLQDAPRLKSILKGASEDVSQPRSIEELRKASVPRSNAVNLIFVISQLASKVSERHFADKVDFFDLTMRATITSASRARAFLWLMWWYLESNFSKEDALNNPFGPGEYKEGQDPDDPEAIPILVPRLEHITEEEGEAENVDTEEEMEFARKMTAERKRIMESNATEPPLVMADPGNAEHKGVKRLKRTVGADDESIISDIDSRASPGIGRSPAPDQAVILTMSSSMGVQADSLEDDFELHDPHPGRGRYKRVRGKNTPSRKAGARSSEVGAPARSALKNSRGTGTPELRATPQPMPPGSGYTVMSQYGSYRGKNEMESLQHGRGDGPTPAHKPRARTLYQRELEEHKAKRIEWALRRRRRVSLKQAREVRERTNLLIRAARRIQELPTTYDSEEEGDGASFGLGGILGRRWATPRDDGDHTVPAGYEEDDWGEEAESWKKVIQRTSRRLKVWSGDSNVLVRKARVVPLMTTADTATTMSRSSLTIDAAPTDITPRKRHPPPAKPSRTVIPATTPKSKKEMDEQITQDLLAERSDDDDMNDDDSAAADIYGGDATEDDDGDTLMY